MRSRFDFPYLDAVRAVTWGALLLLVFALAGCGQAVPPATTPAPVQHEAPRATNAADAPGPLPQVAGAGSEAEEPAPLPEAPAERPAGESPAAPETAPGIMPTLAPSSAERESATRTDGGSGSGEEAAASSSGATPHPTPPPSSSDRVRQFEPVTAGVVDDNEQWQAYLDYRERHRFLSVHDRDVSERYVVQVWDRAGQPVHDAIVRISAAQQLLFEGRSDAGGRLLFHPRALSAQGNQWQATHFEVAVHKGQVSRHAAFGRYEDEYWTITLPDVPPSAGTGLDLLFLIDATGSMQDEIDKLKATMGDIADQIAGLPEQPQVRYGLVAYRDRGDEFVVRAYDFTPDLGAFQQTLASLRAAGGGDEPESLNEALYRSLNDLHWRQDDTVRLILLVADAPPHLDYGEQFSYDTAMVDAVGRGIKIFPVGASGLNEQGEYIFRQLAQFTGGKFVFLTYAQAGRPGSGPGAETGHDVANYSVDTLDRLVVRLVREELAKLPRIVAGQPQQIAQVQTISPAPGGIVPLAGLTGMTRVENGGFHGRWDVDGTIVAVGDEVALTELRGWDRPERIDIPVGGRSASRLVLLLSLANGYAGFDGETVGRLRLQRDGETIEVPLVAGENIRDWCVGRGPYQVVTELRDPAAREVWRGAVDGCEEAALSALVVDLPAGRLHTLTILDESRPLLGDPDPGISVYGLSLAN